MIIPRISWCFSSGFEGLVTEGLFGAFSGGCFEFSVVGAYDVRVGSVLRFDGGPAS